jgi:hypothetical protein
MATAAGCKTARDWPEVVRGRGAAYWSGARTGRGLRRTGGGVVTSGRLAPKVQPLRLQRSADAVLAAAQAGSGRESGVRSQESGVRLIRRTQD